MSRVVVLPSGARVRGRALTDPPEAAADFLLALAKGPLPSWAHRRINWPDFWIPTDSSNAMDALQEILDRAREGQAVEVACRGGRGRTGTALAALAVMDGMTAEDALGWVREAYDAKAVETPWQAWWVQRVAARWVSR